MKTLYLTVGLPRSGKSTWAKQQNVPIVNPDSIRLALHGQPFYPPAEQFVWAMANLMVRALFLAGHDSVILDATNTTLARRQKWSSTEWKTRCVCFDTDAGECIHRACGDSVLVDVIHKMKQEYEAPDEFEDWVTHRRVFLSR